MDATNSLPVKQILNVTRGLLSFILCLACAFKHVIFCVYLLNLCVVHVRNVTLHLREWVV